MGILSTNSNTPPSFEPYMLDNLPPVGFSNPGTVLAQFVQVISQSAPTAVRPSVFLLPHDPPIPLQAFVERLQQYFSCSDSAFVVAGAYLGRLQDKHPDLFHDRSSHKLVL